MEKALATWHLRIILISLRVGVVQILHFFAHASILLPYKVIFVANNVLVKGNCARP